MLQCYCRGCLSMVFRCLSRRPQQLTSRCSLPVRLPFAVRPLRRQHHAVMFQRCHVHAAAWLHVFHYTVLCHRCHLAIFCIEGYGSRRMFGRRSSNTAPPSIPRWRPIGGLEPCDVAMRAMLPCVRCCCHAAAMLSLCRVDTWMHI